MLFMVQGHTINVLLAPQYAGGAFSNAWLYLRGLTSCTFLMLSGFSFSVATVRRWPEYRTPGRRVYRRLGRYAMLLVLGYGMRFPARSFAGLAAVSPAQWQTFAVVDILQLIAVTLTLLQVGVWLLDSPGRLMAWSLGAAAVTVLVTPFVSHAVTAHDARIFLGAYLTAGTGSIFPALPWAAYVFFGAALGVWYSRPAAVGPGTDRAPAFLKIGLGMVAAGTLLHALPWQPYGAIEFWAVSPNLFLAKAGSVLIGMAGTIRLVRGVTKLPGIVTALSRESLLVYLAHVVLLYGSAWSVGLTQSVGNRLETGPVVATIMVLLAVMSLLAWTWFLCKRHLSSLAILVRAVAATILIYGLM